jgi:transcriptional regulator
LYPSSSYPTDPELVERFVAEQRHGTLIATPPGGHPRVSILPFLKRGELIEMHCVRADPTFAAVQANPRVTFLVSDFLAFTPHDFVDQRDAGRATLNFRAASYECEASWSTEPAVVAAALSRLLAAYEPDASYEPLADGAFYGGRLARLAVLELTVVGEQSKFKVGPAVSVDRKREVAARLRSRNLAGDARAADVIESYLPPSRPRPG